MLFSILRTDTDTGYLAVTHLPMLCKHQGSRPLHVGFSKGSLTNLSWKYQENTFRKASIHCERDSSNLVLQIHESRIRETNNPIIPLMYFLNMPFYLPLKWPGFSNSTPSVITLNTSPLHHKGHFLSLDRALFTATEAIFTTVFMGCIKLPELSTQIFWLALQ